MTIDVPRSGWFRTIKVGIKTNIIGIITEVNFFILRVLSDKYLARAIVVNILANSDDWIERGRPKLSQRYVPAWDWLKKGKMTIRIPIQ